jgi:hypothetical protein
MGNRYVGGLMVGCALCLSILLWLAGCGSSLRASVPTPTATPSPTPTLSLPTPSPTPRIITLTSSGAPVAGPTLAWQKAALPAGFGMLFHDEDIGVAPSDGEIAYACTDQSPQGSSSPRVVVTHDGGASWAPAGAIQAWAGGCGKAVVDALVSSTAIVEEGFGPGTPAALTTNGGASWRLMAASTAPIMSLATAGGATYAIRQVDADNGSSSSLSVSTDGLRTWRALLGPDANTRREQ